MRDLAFSGETGIAVGDGGTVWRTTDGAATWVADDLPGANLLHRVVFSTETDVWITGSTGGDGYNPQQAVLFHSADQGLSWIQVDSLASAYYPAITFSDPQTCWMAITYCYTGSDLLGFRRTTDGGVTWQTSWHGGSVEPDRIQFTDAMTGWVSGRGPLLCTSDGGQSWNTRQTWCCSAFFIDAANGWTAGWGGMLQKTTDAGVSWTTVTDTITTASLTDVLLVDDSDGWAVGSGGTILHTSDGGVTWARQPSGTEQCLHALYRNARGDLWVAGGDIYCAIILNSTDNGQSWSVQTFNGCGSLQTIAFTDANHGWAGGNNGVLLRTENGGIDWQVVAISSNWADIHRVQFADPLHGWIVDQTSIHRTADGGLTWTECDLSSGTSLYDIACLDAQTLWAVGGNGRLLHSTDGGNSWYLKDSGTGNSLYAITFVDSHTGWIAGAAGEIRATTDGGVTWSHVVTSARSLLGISAPTHNTAISVGYFGTILRFQPAPAEVLF